jgi:hypothetical protein
MKLVSIISLAVVGLTLSGCSTYEPKPQLSVVGGANFITSTGDLASTIVHKNRICLQPSPDAAFSANDSGGVSILNFGVKDDGVNDSNSQKDTEMTGRTPSVLLARELMYRLCELGNNYALNKTEMLTSYNENLKIIKEIALSESKQTTISITSGITVTTSDSSQDQVDDTASTTTNDEEGASSSN